jgi:hypothetical protein
MAPNNFLYIPETPLRKLLPDPSGPAPGVAKGGSESLGPRYIKNPRIPIDPPGIPPEAGSPRIPIDPPGS